MNGVRLSTLFAGRDIACLKTGQRAQFKWFIPDFPFLCGYVDSPNARVVTHVFQTRELAWFQDVTIGSRIAVQLQMTPEQLSNVGQALKSVDQIAIGLIVDTMNNMGNMGYVANIERHRVDLDPKITKEGKVLAECNKDTDGWQTVFMVDIDLPELLEFYDKCAEGSASRPS
jgi:hypothetical protein